MSAVDENTKTDAFTMLLVVPIAAVIAIVIGVGWLVGWFIVFLYKHRFDIAAAWGNFFHWMGAPSPDSAEEQARRAWGVVRTEPPTVEPATDSDIVVTGRLLISPPTAIGDRPAGDFGWVDPSWETRHHNRKVAYALGELTKQLQTGTGYLQEATRYEHQRLALHETQQRGRLVHHKLDIELSELQKRQARAARDAEAAAEEYCNRQQQAGRQEDLAGQDHRIAILQRSIEIKRLEGILSEPTAAPKPKRKPKPEPPAAEPAPEDRTPDALRRHLAEEDEVRDNRAEADRRVNAICDRAAAEGRDITEDERDEIDAVQEALARAETEIRQGGASDLP